MPVDLKKPTVFSSIKAKSLKIIREKEIKAMNIGSLSPDFALLNTKGDEWRLSERRGTVVALLFYPGDETIVCTKQLCSVRDNWARYIEAGAEVVAISPGTESEHHQFAAHHALPMPLLADSGRAVTQIYGSHWWMPIWATRSVVVVDAKGLVRYRDVMLRAFRPSDDDVLAEIHLAKYDLLSERRLATS